MRIDTHQHFWRYDAREYGWIDDSLAALKRDFLPADSAREMAAVGLDACIAVQARQTLAETSWLLELADAHPWIAGVVGWVDLLSADVAAQLDLFVDHPRFAGVRHVVQSEPDGFLARPEFLAGLARVTALDLPYDILVYERQMPQAIELVERCPNQRFVLDHLGKPDIRRGRLDDWARQLRALATRENVCCKLSGLVTEADWTAWTPSGLRPYIETAAECFTPPRLMIGSDWPVCTVAGSYAEVMNVFIEAIADWTEDERVAVLGGTAARVWRLDPGTRESVRRPAGG